MTDILDRHDIERMISIFYEKLIDDDKIGYFFTDVVKLNLDEHLPKICDFWETTIFHVPVYKGNPMKIHLDLNVKSALKPEHFDRWIEVFCDTVDELFSGEKAELAKQRAISISTMMQIKLSVG